MASRAAASSIIARIFVSVLRASMSPPAASSRAWFSASLSSDSISASGMSSGSSRSADRMSAIMSAKSSSGGNSSARSRRRAVMSTSRKETPVPVALRFRRAGLRGLLASFFMRIPFVGRIESCESNSPTCGRKLLAASLSTSFAGPNRRPGNRPVPRRSTLRSHLARRRARRCVAGRGRRSPKPTRLSA